MSWQDSYGTSPIARQNRARNLRLRRSTRGKCFYCGCPTIHQGKVGERDWMLLGNRYRMVREHVTPTSRAGVHKRENFVPACAGCNYVKGPFTLDEFRLLRGLQVGDLQFRFWGEVGPQRPRDWLCCHSREFEKQLVIHNRRSAADAYVLRRRSGGRPLYEPRVIPVKP